MVTIFTEKLVSLIDIISINFYRKIVLYSRGRTLFFNVRSILFRIICNFSELTFKHVCIVLTISKYHLQGFYTKIKYILSILTLWKITMAWFSYSKYSFGFLYSLFTLILRLNSHSLTVMVTPNIIVKTMVSLSKAVIHQQFQCFQNCHFFLGLKTKLTSMSSEFWKSNRFYQALFIWADSRKFG